MKNRVFCTAWQRCSTWGRGLAWAAMAAGVWALSAGAAQAQGDRGVYWSIGVNQPGVSVGVSNAPPLVYQQRPQVVVVQQRAVVVHQTRPYVVTQPMVVYRERGYRRDDDRRGHQRDKWHKRHDRHQDRNQNRNQSRNHWDD